MKALVVAGANQVGHPPIRDHKCPRPLILYVQHPRHQKARFPNDEPAGLQDEAQARLLHLRNDHAGERVGQHTLLVGIANAVASSEVDEVELDALLGQLTGEFQHFAEGLHIGVRLEDLRSDVDVDVHRVQHAELALAFHVERQNPGAEGGLHLHFGLPHPREDNPLGGNPGRQAAVELSQADDVGAGPQGVGGSRGCRWP